MVSCFEENEVSLNSQGGTEQTKRSYGMLIPDSLQKEFQIIPSRVRNIEEDKIRIYWVHDLGQDPEVSHLKDLSSRNRFHKVVWNSNWQFENACVNLHLPRDQKNEIIETGVHLIPYIPKDPNKTNLIYFSTPQRGLELLIPTVDNLSKKYPYIHLDVFSSYKIYNWPEADKKFEKLYDTIRNHPNMTYHGTASHSVIIDYLQKAHILAYPSIWQETSCRVLIESMMAGLMCVHPNLAVLPETSGNLTLMYQFQDDHSAHASLFHHYLEHAIQTVHDSATQNYLSGFVRTYAEMRFGIKNITKKWEMLMTHLLTEFPSVESRKAATEVWVYKS
jgi:UDP-glucose:(glucosyl)LPS alpha-1,2-glucosyltransferase